MDTIIIVLLVIIVIILVYFVLHSDASMIPLPNTFSNSLPMTTTTSMNTLPQATDAPVVLQPIEVLAPGYPLDEEYYYDPALFYDPYWWWGGWYGSGYSGYNGGYRRWHHQRPRSGDIVHGGIQPGSVHMGGRSGGRMGGGGHH